MKKTSLIIVAILGLGVAAPAWLVANHQGSAAADRDASSVASEQIANPHQLSRIDTPTDGVGELVYARRFRLEKPYASRWTKDRAMVDSGYLVVIRVENEYVYPHEAATPVLFAGHRAIERVNVGYQDGHVIGIIPGADHPATLPIYFGSPDYPERVTAEKGLIELQRAQLRGDAARPAAEVSRAMAIDAGTLVAADSTALFREAGRLIVQYAPAENELGEALQAMP